MTLRPFVFLSTFLPFYLSTFLYSQSINVDKKTIDIGTVKEGSVLKYELLVKNDSGKILNVGIRPSCDCISVECPKRVAIKPKDKIKLKIKIDTVGHDGNFNEKIFFQSNDSERPYIFVAINGFVAKNEKITIPITVFDSAGCLFCNELKKHIIPSHERKYKIKIELAEYTVDEPKNYAALVLLEKKYKKTLNKMPVVFVGDDVIGGKQEIVTGLPKILEKYIQVGVCHKVEVLFEEKIQETAITKLKFLPIVIAGLLDSVNPCAFATLIFFITYLSMVLKKGKYEILQIGIVFIFAVFSTYFVVGLGFFNIIKKLEKVYLFSNIMYFLVGCFALFLSYQYFRDYLAIKKSGTIEKVRTALPVFIRWKIYDVITKCTGFGYILFFVFVVGVIVTLLELFCTGQIYLPTIVYLTSIKGYKIKAISYLLFYCFLFIVPLVVIFLLFWYGITTEKIEAFFREKICILKLLTAVLLLTLGIIIFIMLFFT